MTSGGNPPLDIGKRVLKEVSLHPVTLYGTSLGLGSILFGALNSSVLPQGSLWMVLLGIASTGLGAVNWIYQYFFRHEVYLKNCLKQYAESAEEQRRNEIETLRRQLATDSDLRDEKLLDELLALASVFQSTQNWKLDSYSQFEITHKVNTLFEEGINNLRKTLQLRDAAGSIASVSIRDGILQQREEILTDLTESINQLGHVLNGLQESGLKESGQNLKSIVQELDATLAIARRVQQRIQALDTEGKIAT